MTPVDHGDQVSIELSGFLFALDILLGNRVNYAVVTLHLFRVGNAKNEALSGKEATVRMETVNVATPPRTAISGKEASKSDDAAHFSLFEGFALRIISLRQVLYVIEGKGCQQKFSKIQKERGAFRLPFKDL